MTRRASQTKKPSSVVAEERLALDIARVLRALVAAHLASAEALEATITSVSEADQQRAPELLTQQNVEAVAGLPASTYLELLRAAHCPLQVTHLGKLRVVERGPFLAWIRSLSAPRSIHTAPVVEERSDDAEVAAVLASAGVVLDRAPTSRTRIKRREK